MNNADIERRVSETIEAMPTTDPGWSHEESPLKAWTVKFDGYTHAVQPLNQEGYPVPAYTWKPAPWLTDDRYAMRLVDEMAKAMIVIEIHVTDAYTSVFLGAARLMGKPVAIVDSDRRMAIVLAWLKWKGVPIEG